MRRRHLFYFSLALTAIALFGYAIGPRIADDRQSTLCVINVDLPGPFGFGLNCDSPEFLRLAGDPGLLLERNNTRQSRPAWILAAATIASPLRPLEGAGHAIVRQAARPDIDEDRIRGAISRYSPQYAGYIVLNFAVTVWAIYLMLLLSFGRRDPVPWPQAISFLSCAAILVANDVTKAFFWSPHTQMLNMFVPVAAVYAALSAWAGALKNPRFAIGWGILCGFGIASYGAFAIVPAAILIPAFLAATLNEKTGIRKTAMNAAILVSLAATPILLWAAFVVWRNGGFYMHELSFGQVVWIADVSIWRAAAEIAQKALDLLMLAAPQATAPVAALALCVAFCRPSPSRIKPVILAAALAFVLCIGFYALVGFTVGRLAYSLVPPTVVLAAILSAGKVRAPHILASALAAVAAANLLWSVAKDGPWS